MGDKTSDPPWQFLVVIQCRFPLGHRISFQFKHMYPSVGMVGKRYVFYDRESWSLRQIGYLDPIVLHISSLAMFCTSMPTQLERARTAGTMESSIPSRSYWIPLQLLPLYDLMMPSVSAIKAADNIPFIKGPINSYLNIDRNTNFIQMVCQRSSTKPWTQTLPIARAVKGSSFAVLRCPGS